MKKRLVQLIGAAVVAASGIAAYATDAAANCASATEAWNTTNYCDFARSVGVEDPHRIAVYCSTPAGQVCGTNRFADQALVRRDLIAV